MRWRARSSRACPQGSHSRQHSGRQVHRQAGVTTRQRPAPTTRHKAAKLRVAVDVDEGAHAGWVSDLSYCRHCSLLYHWHCQSSSQLCTIFTSFEVSVAVLQAIFHPSFGETLKQIAQCSFGHVFGHPLQVLPRSTQSRQQGQRFLGVRVCEGVQACLFFCSLC